MTNDTPVHAEDVIPVRSRVSWSAVLAGAMIALAVYFLLTLLGAAIGLSINDRVADRNLAIGAVVWAILVTAGSLFLGGFVASQMTTGENKIEGILYGVLVWCLTIALLILFLAAGVRTGFNAMIAMSNVAANPNMNWEGAARNAGVRKGGIEQDRANIQEPPQVDRQAAEENATRTAWYAFLGTVVAMLAAGLGGYVGAGPTFRLFTVRVDRGATFDRRDSFVRT